MPETTWDLLREIVSGAEYRPGWRVSVSERDGVPELQIVAKGLDTYHPEQGDNRYILHPFILPAATYNRQSWTRWLLDRIIDVETHEACEWLTVNGRRPFAPNHGPGWNPYAVRELNTAEAAETDSLGKHHPGTQG